VDSPRTSLETVLDYHERTKHFPGRYARALGYLDWATQPNPFRRFQGAPLLPLDLVPVGDEPRYEPAFFAGGIPPAPLDRRTVSQLLHDSLALSAWKEAGSSRWSLRVNPSRATWWRVPWPGCTRGPPSTTMRRASTPSSCGLN